MIAALHALDRQVRYDVTTAASLCGVVVWRYKRGFQPTQRTQRSERKQRKKRNERNERNSRNLRNASSSQ